MDQPWVRRAFAAVVVLVAGWQLVAVTATSVPPNRYSAVVEPGTGYLSPYFTQNWRLFAPNPVGDDRRLLIQGAYRTADGTVEQTEWIDWTAVELDLIHHRLVGGRGGYVSNKLIESLSSTSRELRTNQRNVLAAGVDTAPPTWDGLRRDLEGAGVPTARAASLVRYEQAVARLATSVVASREPDVELVAVRYRIRSTPVVPFAERDDPDAERPDPTERFSGWREPVEGSARERAAIVDFDRRHR